MTASYPFIDAPKNLPTQMRGLFLRLVQAEIAYTKAAEQTAPPANEAAQMRLLRAKEKEEERARRLLLENKEGLAKYFLLGLVPSQRSDGTRGSAWCAVPPIIPPPKYPGDDAPQDQHMLAKKEEQEAAVFNEVLTQTFLVMPISDTEARKLIAAGVKRTTVRV